MDRYRSGYKEKYEQIDELEYNEINPYENMIKSIKHDYKDAKIKKVKTYFEWHCLPIDDGDNRKLKWQLVPLLFVFYEVTNERD